MKKMKSWKQLASSVRMSTRKVFERLRYLAMGQHQARKFRMLRADSKCSLPTASLSGLANQIIRHSPHRQRVISRRDRTLCWGLFRVVLDFL